MHSQISPARHLPKTPTALNSMYLCSLLAIAPSMGIAGTGSSKAAETASVRISFSGLDLATPAGMSAAEERLSAAALRACEKFSDSRKVDDRENLSLCYRATLAKAVQHLNALLAATVANQREIARNIP